MNNADKNSKVSIIMPAYNSEKYVAEAIESVLHQTYPNWELLAIDDGSTDSTGSIIDDYAKRDSRITVYHMENRGVSHARNVGLEMASGEWIAFLDSDDLFTKDALLNLLKHSKDKDMVIGNFQEFPVKKKHYLFSDVDNISKIELINKLSRYAAAWGIVYRKSTIRERFIEGLQFGEDAIFRLAQQRDCSKISTIHNIVYKYRRGNEQSLSYQKQNMKISFIERYCQLFLELNPREEEYGDAFFVHCLSGYINRIISADNLTKSQKSGLINEAVESDYFKNIPLNQLRIKPDEMRLFALLKIGDISLIEKELQIE